MKKQMAGLILSKERILIGRYSRPMRRLEAIRQIRKKEFIDSYNSRILKKSSIDKYHTGVISSDVRIPPQRKNSPLSRPETAARNLDFLPKLTFQNFETNLPKYKISSNASKLVLDGRKLEKRRRPMTHPYLISGDVSKKSIPVQLKSHNFEVEKNKKSTEKKLIWRPKSGRVNIRPIETPRHV